MNWVVIVWSMASAICATLAVINAAVWLRNRSVANGFFAVMALSTSSLSLFELALMTSSAASDYSHILRWAHVPIFVLTVAIVCFARVYLRAGRPWLAWTVCILRGITLIVNFLAPENINFRHVVSLGHVTFLGEQAAYPLGERSPWMMLAQTSLLLLTIFVVDAAAEVWKRGERRKAVVAGGAFAFFTFVGVAQSALSFWGVLHLPIIPSVFFTGVVIVMGLELSRDMVRAGELVSKVREGEQRLALAAEAANLGVWSREPGRDEIWASPNWRRLFDFTDEEKITVSKFLDRVHPEDRVLIEEILWEPNRPDHRYELEYRAMLPDGRVRWIASRGRFEPNGNGTMGPARAVSVDITAQKEAERALQDQRTELAHLSRVAMLGELSGSLAHELNQPLTAILSNAQAAQRFLARPDFDREEILEILGDIVSADQQAGEVIRSLRALFKRGETNRQPLDLNAAVQNVLKLVRSDLISHHVVVETKLAEEHPTAFADRVQFQQVLLNLILNAVDAMAETDQKMRGIIVTTEPQDESVRVSVRDSGPGLALGIEEKIFQPFFTTKSHGMGLGLAVCRSILEGHGSTLMARTHSEGGAEFSFLLGTTPPTT